MLCACASGVTVSRGFSGCFSLPALTPAGALREVEQLKNARIILIRGHSIATQSWRSRLIGAVFSLNAGLGAGEQAERNPAQSLQKEDFGRTMVATCGGNC